MLMDVKQKLLLRLKIKLLFQRLPNLNLTVIEQAMRRK